MKWNSVVRLGFGGLALSVAAQACASAPGEEHAAERKSAIRTEGLSSSSNVKIHPEVFRRLQQTKRVRVIVNFHATELDLPNAKRYGHADRALALRAIQDVGTRLIAALPGAALERRFQSVNALVLEVDAATIEILRGRPEVESIVLDGGGSGHLREAVPLARLDVVQATGLSGAGVTVAILDSGVNRTHVDLADSLIDEACFCSGSAQGDSVGCCPNGRETQQGPGSAADDHGHGTNVAGIVTSNGTSAPKGGAPGAQIVAVKVLDSQNAFNFSSDVIAGFDWVISNRPDVKVVNASLGTAALFAGTCDTDSSATAWKTAIDTLRANGVLVFVSSGNESSATSMALPACLSSAVAVGAVWDSNVGPENMFCNETTTAADKITCFTNSDSKLDLLAPGAPITSTGLGGTTAISTFFGTSQASPLAAACAALLLQKDPTLTPDRLEALLKGSPTRITDVRNGLTFPRLDCGSALAALGNTCTPESDTAFCTRLGKACGSVSGVDNCNASRTVNSCGSCTAPQSCGGGGTPNVCGASGGSCAGVPPWDPAKQWFNYTVGERHTGSNHQLYSCQSVGFCYLDPAGPNGSFGWTDLGPC